MADHDRPLNKRGLRDAPRIGQLLREQSLVPGQIFSSSALRARTTATLVAEASGFPAERIEILLRLYLAPPDDYIEVVRHQAEGDSTVMVVGHNPGLEQLLQLLTGAVEHLPTAGLAQVQLELDEWSSFSGRTAGRLVHFWKPKELDD